MAELADRFMRSFGTRRRLSHDLLAPDWLRAAGRASFGTPGLPYYDMDETRYLLSFGADFVEHHLSPVRYGHAFGRMRQGRDTVRGHFTYVGGRMSLTGASADRWLPARPGSEGFLAMAMARLILDESLHDRDSIATAGLRREWLLARLAPYDLGRAASMTGLSQQAIAEVAREFAATRPALAMAGEAVAFHTNGAESVRAVQLLNLLAGSLERPGGLFPDGGSWEGAEDPLAELSSLVGDMRGGRIGAVLVQGDPVHAVPRATGFQDALARVPFVVSFSTLLDDTALMADLILPDHAALESWGEVIPLAGAREEVIGLMQPVVNPLLDTRQFPDVLLAAAVGLGGETAAALPYGSYLEMLKSAMARRVGLPQGERFEEVWVELLAKGGLFRSEKGRGRVLRWLPDASIPHPEPPRFAGDAGLFPLHLQVYPSVALLDGRGASLPWLQQLPDPMTGVVWGSWVEINPGTAAGHGIASGDLVEVASPLASLRLPAVIYPGIRPDMVAIPMGQGHRGMGRYAAGRGANALALVAATMGEKGPIAAWNATRVRITRISGDGGMVTAGDPAGSLRSELIEI